MASILSFSRESATFSLDLEKLKSKKEAQPETEPTFYRVMSALISIHPDPNGLPVLQKSIEYGTAIWKPAYFWTTQFVLQERRIHDYPFNTPYFKMAEPLGVFLYQLRRICGINIEIIDRTRISFTFYRNANDWWADVCSEVEFGHLQSNGKTIALFRGSRTLEDGRIAVRDEALALLDKQNPFDPRSTPRLEYLVRVALALQEHNPREPREIKELKGELRRVWEKTWKKYKPIYGFWRKNKLVVRQACDGHAFYCIGHGGSRKKQASKA